MWFKRSPLLQQGHRAEETWIRDHGDALASFPVELYLGKKTDLLSLKNDIVQTLAKQVAYYQESRRRLYAGPTAYVCECPVTGIPTTEARLIANVYGAEYVQTPDTGHVYVRNRPTNRAIHDFYLNDVTYAATYTDKRAAERRLHAIAIPWRDWMIDVFKKTYGRMPKRILDVGSGAGHFVEACRRGGIVADGVELSQSSREFAQQVWGLELDGRDILEAFPDYRGCDVVTFWGLLEHTPNPRAILSAAHDIVAERNGGMVVSKLPRWNSLSSACQRLCPNTIIRHIDPMGHIMLFSDASAAELYYRCGFKPTAAWYYGMDVYELFMQVSHAVQHDAPLTETKELQLELQQFVDEARFSDGLTLVGIPL